MPMKTRLEEVNDELKTAKDRIDSIVIVIGIKEEACLVPKSVWDKFDNAIEQYAKLRIEKASLEKGVL